MTNGVPVLPIQDLIASVSERLTPTERRITEAVLEDPTLLAFGTVSDLAYRVGTSRPSIVRFATKLGFEGYTDLQAWIRDGVSQRLSSPSERIRHQNEPDIPMRKSIEEAMHATLAAFDEQRLTALAAPIANARNVWILSGETSMAGAHVLHSGLAMIRPDVHLVDEHSSGRQLSSASQ
ncbi:MAG: MurR/RpiR family transcriptional regulator, partial [Planctomycetota bacterium]